MKKIKWESLLILVITIIVLHFVLKDNFETSIALIFSSNLVWIIIAIIIFIIQFFMEAYIMYLLIHKYSKDYSYKNTVKLNLITKFFNGVTPFSSGGQPFQIIELKRDNVDYDKSAIVVIEDFLLLQVAVIMMSFVAFLIGLIFKIIDFSSFLGTLTFVGFVINLLILLFVLFISKKIDIAKNIGIKFINFLSKIYLIKNVDTLTTKWISNCTNYYFGIEAISKDKKLLWKCIRLNIVYMIIYLALPFFIFKAVGVTNFNNIFLCTLLSFYIYLCGSYIPLPGGTFGIEYAFINFYKTCIKDIFLSPALIIWRFLTYYLPMIIGAIVYNFKRNVKN